MKCHREVCAELYPAYREGTRRTPYYGAHQNHADIIQYLVYLPHKKFSNTCTTSRWNSLLFSLRDINQNASDTLHQRWVVFTLGKVAIQLENCAKTFKIKTSI